MNSRSYAKTPFLSKLISVGVLIFLNVEVSRAEPSFEEGKKIYETVAGLGCKACHGPFGEGKLGPTNRGVNEATVREALAKIGPMQFLKGELTEDDIKNVAAYTQWMGQHMLVTTLLKRGRFIPDEILVRPGTPIQLVIDNTGTEPSTIASDNMKINAQTVPARDVTAIIWTAPDNEGAFTLACKDCRIKDGFFTITVAKAAKPYVPPPQPKIVAKP